MAKPTYVIIYGDAVGGLSVMATDQESPDIAAHQALASVKCNLGIAGHKTQIHPIDGDPGVNNYNVDGDINCTINVYDPNEHDAKWVYGVANHMAGYVK